MAVLDNSKHEHFAQLVAKGVSATKAYTSAGYSDKGAKQSAARLLTNADLCARIRELQETLSAGTIDRSPTAQRARAGAAEPGGTGTLAGGASAQGRGRRKGTPRLTSLPTKRKG